MQKTPLQETLDPTHHLSRSAGALLTEISTNTKEYLHSYFTQNKGPFTLIDVGCSTGNTLDQLVGRWQREHAKDFRGVALDIAPQSLIPEHAQTPYANLAWRVSGSAKELPVANNSIDFGYSIETMQYVDDTLAALAEGHRVLKPGGVFFWRLLPSGLAQNLSWSQVEKQTPGSAFKGFSDLEDLFIICKKDGTFKGFPYTFKEAKSFKELHPRQPAQTPSFMNHVRYGIYTPKNIRTR